MKLEIDLNDILGDENGVETLQESVRRQVIEALSGTIKQGIQKQITTETAQVINTEMQKALADKMPMLMGELMDAQYTPVDRWGDRSKGATTFRAELVKQIHEQMVYKKSGYSSDNNAFTKAVDGVVDAKMAEFKSAFLKEVDARFVADAMQYATTKLAERLGVKK